MEYKDYYKIMGLNHNATEKDIKVAYRRLARKYHPDISKDPNGEEKFKELGEAYEVLKDPQKRATYDQFSKDWELNQQHQQHQQQRGKHTSGRRRNAGSGHTEQSFQYSRDFFESLFGEGAFRQQNIAGEDYHGNITITLEEAYHGMVKQIHLPSPHPSSTSGGQQTLKVKIPAGVKSGQQIRLAGQGAPGLQGGNRGDLYLTVHVAKHNLFEVMENNVYLTLPLAPWEAALGTTVVVPTLGGKVDVKIPPNSQAGQTLRLKKRGLPGTSPGDQLVILKIIIPQPHNEDGKALYKKMAEVMPFNPREALGV